MIEATLQEVTLAYRALRRINDETRQPAKAAWRISRLLGKMSSPLKHYEEAQVKLILDAGGIRTVTGAMLQEPVRNGEDPETWAKILEDDSRERLQLREQLTLLSEEKIKIEYDPIPLTMLDDDPAAPPDKKRGYSANDFADLGPFISEVDLVVKP